MNRVLSKDLDSCQRSHHQVGDKPGALVTGMLPPPPFALVTGTIPSPPFALVTGMLPPPLFDLVTGMLPPSPPNSGISLAHSSTVRKSIVIRGQVAGFRVWGVWLGVQGWETGVCFRGGGFGF